MVIVLHLHQHYGIPDPHTFLGYVAFFLQGRGGDGVGIFFVLSGFLITTLLIREKETTGKIDLRDFYLRRTFRILPPLYAYLLFLIVYCAATHATLHPSTITGSMFFYLNYFPQNAQWMTEHTWSLCVEEQFYLLWPLALLWAWKKGGRSKAAKVAAFLIVLTPLLRVASKLSHLAIFNHRLDSQLHARMDSLMCGCLIALCIGNPRFERVYGYVAKVWWLLPLQFLVISGLITLHVGIYYLNSIGLTIDAICIAFFLLWAARNPETLVGRILNSWVMTRLGVLSYSIYIWQTFFIHGVDPHWVHGFPQCLVFIAAAALFSYNCIEMPSLRLRKRMERRMKVDNTRITLPLTPAESE